MSDIIEWLVENIITLVNMILGIVLTPINIIINLLVPDFINYVALVDKGFDVVDIYINYARDLIPISDITLGLLFIYLTFRFTATLQIWLIKNAWRWLQSILKIFVR